MGQQERDDRFIAIVAWALAFLWPARWTGTRRGLWLCFIATFGLAGALIGLIVGVCLTVAGVSL
jgi:hypothetical protein